MEVRTVFKFVLPDKDEAGSKIRGKMKLLKVKDVMHVQRDRRVQENPHLNYLVLLNRVIENLGDAKMITTGLIEKLSPKNFIFLVDFMDKINHQVLKQLPISCDKCHEQYFGEVSFPGER